MNPDTAEVDNLAVLQSIHALLKKAQLRWAGHVVRMSDGRISKRLPHGELSEGRKSTGGQRKCNEDALKSPLKAFGINNAT